MTDDDRPADAEDPDASVEVPETTSADVHDDGDFPTGRVEEARRALEAVLMVVEEPAEPGLLAQLLELPTEAVELGWLLEELRVSEFAQTLGTAVSVSPQRISRDLARLGA